MIDNKITVLIIDDDEVDKQMVKRALKSSGFIVEVIFADDIESGIALAIANSFDCIFLDYSLPGATGFDFLSSYKEQKGQTPVIMITSLGDEQLAVEAMKNGACDYIPKNHITPNGISQSIRYVLKLNEARQNTSHIKKALEESERRLEHVISKAPLILFSIDPQGKFTMFKGNGTKHLDFNADEITGSNIFDNGNPFIPVKLQDYLSACLGKENCFKTKCGDRHFEVHFTPVRDSSGEILEMIGVVTDITSMKQHEEALVKTISVAEEISKIKEQFMANMSHEIRTPVHGILSLTDILLKSNLDEKQASFLSTIKRSADNLLIIVNDILDLSKIEAGKMTFEDTPFEFFEVIKLVIDLFQHKANEKGLEMICNISDNIPGVLKGDPVRLSQILNNLMSNAIKFTDAGYVKLEIKAVESNEAACIISFEISDTGIGIQAQKLTTIFDAFTQAGEDITRKYGGTGLGLSIVKRLTEMQGGYLKIESEFNKGTSIRVNLPFNYSNKEVIKQENYNLSEPDVLFPENLSVLVVEDNEINKMIINKFLKDWGILISNASNGLEAVDMVRKNNYHLVLMDIEMPVMNGYEATKQIRKDLPSPKNSIPVCAMTAHASATEKEKCFISGMNDYIIKPFDAAEIKNKIASLTSLNSIAETGASISDRSMQPTKTEPVKKERHTNLSFLKEMSDDNDAFVRDFILLFLKNTPETIMKLEEHYKRMEWEQIRQIAHKIKPSLNYLGLKELYTAAGQLEEYTKQGNNLDKVPDLIMKILNVCKIAITELEEDIKTITYN